MNVLAITSLFPSVAFPTRAVFNRQHLSALASMHQVDVICPVPWHERWLNKHGACTHIRPENIDLNIIYHTYWYLPGISRGLAGHLMYWSIRRSVLEVARIRRPDVVLGVWAYPDGASAVSVAKDLDLPVAIQVLGSDLNLLEEYPVKLEPTRKALQTANLVLPVSQALAHKVAALGVPEDRIKVVYRGVSDRLFQPRDVIDSRKELGLDIDRDALLYIGNLLPVKGIESLVRAFAVVERDQAVDLHIVGDGPLLTSMQQLAKDLGCAERVKFHGRVSHDLLPIWFGASSLVVLPSLAEGVPNVLLEARACGRPYVASAVGGVPEISDHSMATLIPPDNVGALANAISSSLRAPRKIWEKVDWRSWQEAAADLADALQGEI